MAPGESNHWSVMFVAPSFRLAIAVTPRGAGGAGGAGLADTSGDGGLSPPGPTAVTT